MKIHHIGYLVKDMEKAVTEFQSLGYKILQPPIYDNARMTDFCFISNDNVVVELVAPRAECKSFKSLVKKVGNSPYHICYIAENFYECVESLQKEGYLMIQPPQEAIAINGKKVAFFYNESIGIIELLESPPPISQIYYSFYIFILGFIVKGLLQKNSRP